jgi:hypothetical protein
MKFPHKPRSVGPYNVQRIGVDPDFFVVDVNTLSTSPKSGDGYSLEDAVRLAWWLEERNAGYPTALKFERNS